MAKKSELRFPGWSPKAQCSLCAWKSVFCVFALYFVLIQTILNVSRVHSMRPQHCKLMGCCASNKNVKYNRDIAIGSKCQSHCSSDALNRTKASVTRCPGSQFNRISRNVQIVITNETISSIGFEFSSTFQEIEKKRKNCESHAAKDSMA